ncbi:bis(5'-adenosyl)-triphosphatase-like [Patiria miniata]|uniref:Bis(5'-adenosyl)-triphosphatase n=1 Tax=Patiria miniata TaxID=46514 RepID=A0A914B0M9_PATMI|nr:bis(5'-adenosyl)-triphosphatase-like [Patiria miniata]XP_038069548.1 bis(5'-adenosyl)-triphosphatase-like [Patiria miniata]
MGDTKQPPSSDDMRTFVFGQHIIKATQVFFKTPLSFGVVNRMPVQPGHVLVCPLRKVERFRDMTSDEVTDMFQSVHLISKALEVHYGVTAMSIGLQDGPDAGQSVKHVHIHIVPRRKGDFKNNDDIYPLLEKNDHVAFDAPSTREWRTEDDMRQEAFNLRQLFPETYTKDL